MALFEAENLSVSYEGNAAPQGGGSSCSRRERQPVKASVGSSAEGAESAASEANAATGEARDAASSRAATESRRVIRLEGVSFSLEAGDICDLTGPSGNGKSMLFRALALMMERQRGVMRLNGKPDANFAPTRWRRHVCLVPQQVALRPGTVRENLLVPWTLKVNAGTRPPSDGELTAMLEGALLDVGLDHNCAKLSGGQAARVALIRSLITRPEVLLLDEVDAALDDDAAKAVAGLIAGAAREGAACMRIRHRQPDGLASETFRLEAGRLEKVRGAASEGGE